MDQPGTDGQRAAATAPPFPPPPPPAPTAAIPIAPPRPHRAGELTSGWRWAMAIGWIAVMMALAAIWNTSVQLGLSTWWLGPRGDPQPRVVQLVVFLPPLLVLLATINGARRLPWWGLAAAAILAGVGAGDLGRVDSLAVVELVVAGSGAALSIAALTGTYRPVGSRDAEPAAEAAGDRSG